MTNFPNGVASFGQAVLPSVLQQPHSGRVYWVSNNTTTPSSQVLVGQDIAQPAGGTYNRPFSTIDFAIGQCRSAQGDVIIVKEGHAESVAAANSILCDVAGVKIVGLGTGPQRPVITFTTTTTATIGVTAAGVEVHNMIFAANFDSVVAAFTLTTAADFHVENCAFRDTSVTDVSFVNLVDTNTTTNDARRLTLLNNTWISEDDASATMVKMDGQNEDVVISGNRVDFAVSTVVGSLMTIAANIQVLGLLVQDNVVTNQATTVGALITGTAATSTGWIIHNYVSSKDVAGASLAAAVTTPLSLHQNWYTGALAEPRAIDSIGTIFNDA